MVKQKNNTAQSLSVVRALPLEEEPGLGALSLPGYLREVSARYAEREAVVMHHADGVVRWSYQQLWQQSLDVARALIACGVGKGSRVGILMTNRPEFLSAFFGAAIAGGVSVPLSTFSTANELEHMLKVSEISVLLFEDRVLKKDFAETLLALEPALQQSAPGELNSRTFPYLRRLVAINGVTAAGAPPSSALTATGFETWAAFMQRAADTPAELAEARATSAHAADPGGLFFSSGTTSLPKAILHRQRAFTLQYWRWPRLWGLSEPTRSWTGNGFFWSGPAVIVIGSALSSGGAIILQPLFDAAEALKLIEAEKVTLLNGRPHQWARMQAESGWENADLSSLRQVTKGEIILEHPTVSTDWDMPNAFGTTETMSILSSFVRGDPENSNPANFGPPLPGNTLKIVDPMSGEPVPMGERGEVCIKGPTLMLGYLGKSPEEVFDEDGFYRTGDGGYIDDRGHLFWEGRLNDIIKTGGANVSPEEVDTAIAGYPGVKRTQTVGVPHDTLSEMVVACIVPVDGVSLEEGDIITFLKETLASFKVPRRVLFFKEEEFALTGSEKVKAGEIRELAAKRLGVSG